MAKKRIGDYIEHDFHTRNTKEIRDYLEKEFVVSGDVREWNDDKRYLTCSADKDYLYATNTAWEHYIPTETFKEMVGMKKENKQTSTKVAFTKSSLKDGMVVITRNGNVYTVTGRKLLREGGMFIHLDDLEDDLTCAGVDQLDVVSVQETTTLFKRETERDSKQQRIAKELEFAEAKRERLNAHIERLKRNLQN